MSQRALFDLLDHAWRRFERDFTGPDGRLNYDGRLTTRDGVDDFYEVFFNWPQLYLLGGAGDLLSASEKHWEGVTRQLTELGMLHDEFERGYDWFHQGESLLLLYFLCMADPEHWSDRALRFAELYVDPAKGNYDPDRRIIKRPHNGSDPERSGLSEGDSYPWLPKEAELYGFPLDWILRPTPPRPRCPRTHASAVRCVTAWAGATPRSISPRPGWSSTPGSCPARNATATGSSSTSAHGVSAPRRAAR